LQENGTNKRKINIKYQYYESIGFIICCCYNVYEGSDMKNVAFFLLSIFLFVAVCCKGQNSDAAIYTIDGVASVPDNGMTAYLFDINTESIIDSILVDSGRFAFKGVADPVKLCKVSIGQKFVSLILEEGIISADLPNNIVSGGPLNKAFTDYLNQLFQIYDNMPPTQNELLTSLTNLMDSTLNSNSDNIVAAVVLSEMITRYRTGQIDSAVVKLGKDIVELPMVRKIIKQNEAVKKTAIGQKFIDFTIEQPDGRKASLSDYVGKEKYVLVDFWASWCAPCRAEVPNLKEIYAKYKGDKFEIVGVTVGDEAEHSIKAIENDGVVWPQILNGGETLKNLYGRRYIPYMMLLDPDGTIIANNFQGKELEKHLVGIFSEK
jgi:thiol-disulfide isomerase/thioredoxin